MLFVIYCRYVFLVGDVPSEDVVRYNLSVHKNVVTVVNNDLVVIKVSTQPGHVTSGAGQRVRNETLLNAASNLILASYRNQLAHVFVRVAIVAMSINGCRQETMTIGMPLHSKADTHYLH